MPATDVMKIRGSSPPHAQTLATEPIKTIATATFDIGGTRSINEKQQRGIAVDSDIDARNL